MKHTPIYNSQRSNQQIYKFANGLAASVIKGQEIAVIRLHDGEHPNGGFHIDYRTPFGEPHHVQAVDAALDEIAGFTPEQLQAHHDQLLKEPKEDA